MQTAFALMSSSSRKKIKLNSSRSKSKSTPTEPNSSFDDDFAGSAVHEQLPSIPSLSFIKNKQVKSKILAKERQKHQKLKDLKRKRIDEERKAAIQAGLEPPPKPVPKTLDNTREKDETVVEQDDEEIEIEERVDELSDYFSSGLPPKTLITTNVGPSAAVSKFVNRDLLPVLHNAVVVKRKTYTMDEVMIHAKAREFTNLIVVNEDRKKPNGLLLIHLPNGPSALFKLTSILSSKQIEHNARASDHRPEVILNGFSTRIGRTIGRFLASLFPQSPQFRGRRVVTFHNQRDFIFFRHHRYIFENGEKVRIQEAGPRFTLKLRALQKGLWDRNGEYEWHYKSSMSTSRRRFFL